MPSLSAVVLTLLSPSLINAILHKDKHTGPDYESLPDRTIFPGPWESNIRAPVNKSYIVPTKIYNLEGAVSGAEYMLEDADTTKGISWVIGPGGLISFEFAENIAGR